MKSYLDTLRFICLSLKYFHHNTLPSNPALWSWATKFWIFSISSRWESSSSRSWVEQESVWDKIWGRGGKWLEYFEEKPVLQLCTLAQGPSSLAPAQFSSQFDPHSSPLPPLSSQTATALAQSQDKLPKNVNSGYGRGTDRKKYEVQQICWFCPPCQCFALLFFVALFCFWELPFLPLEPF